MTDRLKLEGVFTKGYGTIPKLVMQDENLTIEAKGIYAYLCSYAGAGETAFPSVSRMCNDLGISDNRLYKHRKLLVDRGYLKIERERLEKGFSKNIYTISSTVHPQNEGVPNDSVDPQNVGIGNEDIGNVDIGNEGTNNNSTNNNIFNNNNINNNNDNEKNAEISKSKKPETQNKKDEESKLKKENTKEVHRFYQENFGIESQYIAQEIEYLVEDLSIELVLEAMKRAIEYGKEFGYAKRIMNNWIKKNIDSMEKVEQADVEFERKNQNRFSKSNNKQQSKQMNKEPIPDWANKENKDKKVTETNNADEPVDPGREGELKNRLDRLKKLREEKGVQND